MKALGVNLVVEGSLRQVDRNVRVTYALIDPKTKHQIHGDSIVVIMSDPFAVEDRVVDSVLSSLQVELQPQQRQALNAGRPTEPSAYDFYLQGRGYLQDYHKPENVESAISVFQRALQADPKFALAYAGLGEAYWRKWYFDRKNEEVQSALDACHKSVQLAPDNAAGHICLGLVNSATGKYEEAVQDLDLATKTEPTNDLAFLTMGRALEKMNNLPAAEQAYRKGIALHPSYWNGYNLLGTFQYRQKQYADALETFKKTNDLAPDNFLVLNNIAGVYLATGNYKDAAAAAERSLALRPTGPALANAGTAYFFQHRFDDSVTKLKEGVRLDPNRYDLWLNLAESQRWAGHKADSIVSARKAIALSEDALRLNPRDALAESIVGYANSLQGSCAKVGDTIEKAVKLAPANQDVLLFAALAYKECKEEGKAKLDAENALKAGIFPSQVRDHPALSNLALKH